MQPRHPDATSNQSSYAQIESLLKKSMGLDASSIGSSTIASAVQRRMSACGQPDAQAYLARLLDSRAELNALIEEVVIPETWFFRDGKAFEALRHYVTQEWLPAHTQGKLRLLSLPCSTGEEPYSIAMSLIDSGLPLERIHIDAVDISTQALARAQRAVYNEHAFRAEDLSFRERFFQRTDAGFALDERIRRPVNFIQANLLDSAFMPGQGIYDVIFCRNLMIYFDHATQTQAVNVLTRLLHARGILFVGHAESSLILNHAYVSEHIPHAFAFRKLTPPPLKPVPPPVRKKTGSRAPDRLATLFQSRRPAAAFAVTETGDDASMHDELEQALSLANQGNLIEATRLCENWLAQHDPCARVCYLLGLICEASGNQQQAEDHLRKALYLQPDHQEALVHLALLVEQKGDHPAAEILRQRARRADEALSSRSSRTGR